MDVSFEEPCNAFKQLLLHAWGVREMPLARSSEGISRAHEAAVGHRVSVRLEVSKELIDLLILRLVVAAHRMNLLGNIPTQALWIQMSDPYIPREVAKKARILLCVGRT